MLNKYLKPVPSNKILTLVDVLTIYDVDHKMKEAVYNLISANIPDVTTMEIITDKVYFDVYDVCNWFKIKDPAAAHAVKKMLMTGNRGHKNREEDLYDIIQSITRISNTI